MSKTTRAILVCLTLIGTVGMAKQAEAAEFTDLLDAADDKDDYDPDTYDPFDFNLEPTFTFETGKAEITREAPCVAQQSDKSQIANPRTQVAPERCNGDVGVVDNSEMTYRHQEARMDFALRIGMYKDLELRINAPFVFTSTHGMKYAEGVNEGNSSVDPSEEYVRENANQVFNQDDGRPEKLRKLSRFKQHRYFALSDEFDDQKRGGFGDPSIGVHWAPFNGERDDTKATMLLGMDYVVPIAQIRKPNNDGVGEGMHKLKWKFASSKQFDWIDPYFGLEYMLQLPSRGSPIEDLKDIDTENEGQTVTNPPHEGEISIGTEFVPHEDESEGQRYAIDLGFKFGYVSEGRDYTPLFDHMSGSRCNDKSTSEIIPQFDGNGNLENPEGVGCSWIAQRPANVQPSPKYDIAGSGENTTGLGDDSFRTNGIMTVESHATFAGHLGLYLQPSEYFQIKALTSLTHKQEHFLTNARTGSDAAGDDNQNVDLTGDQASIERNPAYNSTYDSPGTRFRVNEFNTWRFSLTAAAQF